MTELQRRRFYFPAWAAAFAATWEVDRGTVVRRVGRSGALLAQIEELALGLARPGRVAADHLRHACHVAALGRDKSANDLTNAELDRVRALFGQLADPDDLTAVIAWEHPEQDARRRLEWAVAHSGFPEAYVRHVAGAKFGSAEWRSLPDGSLRQVLMTLKGRAQARRRKLAKVEGTKA
jgi:hypothetical protein